MWNIIRHKCKGISIKDLSISAKTQAQRLYRRARTQARSPVSQGSYSTAKAQIPDQPHAAKASHAAQARQAQATHTTIITTLPLFR